MKRLTRRYVDGQAYVSLNQLSAMGENECVGLPITKLARYEDLEEQGLSLRLPCNAGDTVYVVHSISPTRHVIAEVETDAFFLMLSVAEGRIGKTVFLTREEAEAALEKMKGEEHE